MENVVNEAVVNADLITSVEEQNLTRGMLSATANNAARYTLQELEKKNIITTPTDTPLLTMMIDKAHQVYNTYFQWTETPLGSNLTSGKYGGYSVGGIDETTPDPVLNGNYIMQVGQIARVANYVKGLRGVEIEGGAFYHQEIVLKYANLRRMVEYYLWRGNHTTFADETDGVCTLVTTAIANGNATLDEVNLEIAIVQMIDAGLEPKGIFAQPLHAQRIARFNKAKVLFSNVNEIENGVGQKAFMYSTAFGYILRVYPTRTVYLPSGKIYVLDTDMININYLSDGNTLFGETQLADINDGSAKLFRCWFGLELKRAADHRVITGVTTDLQ